MLNEVLLATLANTPAKYDSPDGDWAAISGRVSVIIYNPALISASPAADLGHATSQFWAYESNPSYGQAAPFALVMIGIAALPSYVLGRFFNRSASSSDLANAEGMTVT